jgi:hypothetical protein
LEKEKQKMTDELIRAHDFPKKLIRKVGTESVKADMNEMNKTNRVLTEDEKALVDRFMFENSIQTLLYHSQTDFNETIDRMYLPPIGYSATLHRNTPFDPNLFYNLFMRYSMIKVSKLVTVDVNTWKAGINALIPDQSPFPPLMSKSMDKDDPWYPSLGRQGWISISETMDWVTLQTCYVINVVSSVDPAVQNEMEIYMNKLQSREITIHAAEKNLQWFRDIVDENQKRIFYLLVTHLKGLTTEAPVECSAKKAEHVTITRQTKKWLESCGLRNLDQFCGYYPIPMKCPNHCPPFLSGEEWEKENEDEEEEFVVDTQPKGIRPDFSAWLDDLIDFPGDVKHKLRLSGHCLLQDQVVRIVSPVGPIMLFKTKNENNLKTAWLHSYPAIATETPRDPRVTNEDIMIQYNTNPVIVSEFGEPVVPQFKTLSNELGKELVEPTATCMVPKLVRISSIGIFIDSVADDLQH